MGDIVRKQQGMRFLRMAFSDEDDFARYLVLVNDEEQYSLWPEEKSIPAGWNATQVFGSKAECVAYVDSVWTDMRPLSLRRRMEG